MLGQWHHEGTVLSEHFEKMQRPKAASKKMPKECVCLFLSVTVLKPSLGCPKSGVQPPVSLDSHSMKSFFLASQSPPPHTHTLLSSGSSYWRISRGLKGTWQHARTLQWPHRHTAQTGNDITASPSHNRHLSWAEFETALEPWGHRALRVTGTPCHSPCLQLDGTPHLTPPLLQWQWILFRSPSLGFRKVWEPHELTSLL